MEPEIKLCFNRHGLSGYLTQMSRCFKNSGCDSVNYLRKGLHENLEYWNNTTKSWKQTLLLLFHFHLNSFKVCWPSISKQCFHTGWSLFKVKDRTSTFWIPICINRKPHTDSSGFQHFAFHLLDVSTKRSDEWKKWHREWGRSRKAVSSMKGLHLWLYFIHICLTETKLFTIIFH